MSYKIKALKYKLKYRNYSTIIPYIWYTVMTRKPRKQLSYYIYLLVVLFFSSIFFGAVKCCYNEFNLCSKRWWNKCPFLDLIVG